MATRVTNIRYRPTLHDLFSASLSSFAYVLICEDESCVLTRTPGPVQMAIRMTNIRYRPTRSLCNFAYVDMISEINITGTLPLTRDLKTSPSLLTHVKSAQSVNRDRQDMAGIKKYCPKRNWLFKWPLFLLKFACE